MNKKELKQDGEIQMTIKPHLLKVESKEGQVIYIFSKMYDHPIKQQIKFMFGQVNVFIEKQGIKCFKSEMNSMECLNQGIDWDLKYFDKISTCLEKAERDFTYNYLLISYSFKRSEGNEPVPCEYVLTISERVLARNDVVLLRVYLIENPSLSTLDCFYRFSKEIMDKKESHIKELNDREVIISQQRQKLASDIEFISHQAQIREKEILRKFVLLLNEKKKEICRLNQMNGLINNQIIEEEQHRFDPIEFLEEKQIKHDEDMGPSQFIVSQLDNLLFTQDEIKREWPFKKTKI